MNKLRVGGMTPFTTIDYPGELAAVVFCQGCPWRCRYCQNTGLLDAGTQAPMRWEDVSAFLERRAGLLDAVVFSGGEPTLQRGVDAAVAQAHTLGFKVGLHTAGCYPERLEKLLADIDWVGLDIKTLPEHYRELTSVKGSGAAAWASLEQVLGSRVNYEVRVTVHPELLPADRLDDLLYRLSQAGVSRLALQRCRTTTLPDAELIGDVPPITRGYSALFDHFLVRWS
jgi:pyruvate formate lyase activating enzyme